MLEISIQTLKSKRIRISFPRRRRLFLRRICPLQHRPILLLLGIQLHHPVVRAPSTAFAVSPALMPPLSVGVCIRKTRTDVRQWSRSPMPVIVVSNQITTVRPVPTRLNVPFVGVTNTTHYSTKTHHSTKTQRTHD